MASVHGHDSAAKSALRAVSDPPSNVVADSVSWDLDALYREHSAYVAAVAFRLLGRSHEVDDVVQDVFLTAMKTVDQVREPLAVRGWLATIAVHAASRKLKVRKLRRFFSLNDSSDYDSLLRSSGDELTCKKATPEQRITLANIYTVLDRLPVDERIPWVLRRLEGERLDQVAKLCSISLATAKRKIDAAQLKLDQVLA